VGEIKESRTAMKYAQSLYPELEQKYSFELPENYDFRSKLSHNIPADMESILNDC
jgi:hypothetical protein